MTTDAADSVSAAIAVRRRPMRSTTAPDTTLDTSRGAAVAAASTPAAPGLPVRSSTNHGSTTMAAPFPAPDSIVEVSSSISGCSDLGDPLPTGAV